MASRASDVSAQTIIHAGVAYRTVALESCLELAMGIQRAGRKWHPHVLSPDCVHNPYAGAYAIVVEDDTDGVAYIAPSDNFPDVDKDLVKILHGDDILDPSKVAAEPGGSVIETVLLRVVAELNGKGADWHHHMHFPTCILSPHKGKWSIVIESANLTVSESYNNEPVDILRAIE